MPYAAFPANGCVLSVLSGTNTFDAIKGIVSLSFAGGEFEDIDATALDDAAPVTLPGAAATRTGDGTINVDLTDAQHIVLQSAYSARTLKTFRIVLADTGGTTRYFDAYVAAPLDLPSLARNTPGQVTLKLQISGAVRTTIS